MAITYKATNDVNGKRYVGVTRKTLDQRRNAHLKRARWSGGKPTHFHSALLKYGIEVFRWEILETYETYEEALRGEERLVEAMKPEYNSRAGGRQPLWVTDATRAKQSIAKIGKKHTDEAKAKMSQNLAGHAGPNPAAREATRERNRNRVWTEEDRANLSLQFSGIKQDPAVVARRAASNTGKKRSEEFANYQRQRMLDDPIAMEKIAAVGRASAGTKRPEVALRNQEPEFRRKVSAGLKGRCPLWRCRPIICLDDEHIYDSSAEAARAYDLHPTCVHQVCSGKLKHTKGKTFSFLSL